MVDGMFRYVVCRKSLILFTRYYSSSNKFFTIGDTQIKVRKPLFPHLVPIGFAVDEPSTSTLSLLKWMVQKDSLRQDIFLIGAPGPRRLDLVLKYLELCGREYEYLPITRDTTEGDIKQRRELRSGTAYYTDLCAVRAALNGRVLIIDGVEKAERNVLPILNSLLESREMQLDDGRFLIPAERYNWLLKELGEGIMCEKKLERVSNDFMIIALGLPVPPFRGHSLDPPLRSRFQCRSIFSRDFATVMRDCSEVAPNVLSNGLTNLISSIFALNFTELRSFSLPQFPLDNISRLAAIWNNIPELSPGTIFELGYPYKSLVTSGPQELAFEHYLLKFYIDAGRKRKKIPLRIESIDSKDGVAEIRCGSSIHRIKVPVGASDEVASRSIFTAYVNNDEQDRFMAKMILSHASGDFCILGPKGCGKTTIVEEFATRLGYPCGTMTLYQDMNSRELLQERRMLSNGDTIWEDSVLVDCAKEGKICVIDGIERVHWSTLEILSPLVHHRQIDLFDGTRLVESGRFKRISVKTGLSKDQLKLKGLFEIHPSFRIIAIGDSNNESRWLNDQILSLFVFHTMESLNIDSQCHIVNSIVPYSSVEETRKLVAFVNSLMHSTDAGLRSTAQSISLRRIIHLIQRHTAHKDEDISEGIKRAAMAKFLPSVTKDAFMGALGKTEFRIGSKLSKTPKCNVDLKRSSVGGGRDIDRTMVPEVLFYDNEQHSAIIVDMVRDMELGSHLLLIGNQGVGKNKVTDRLLHLINRPRRYLQLHRDITVQSLTVNSSVIDGCLIHEDSALVKAARDGDVLVIDEADKAPLHVVAVLKSLLDIGVLRLADGRVIEPKNISKGHRSIPLHPDFRIIMLANRPGFPFLGNDLFSILGDLFAVHVVDNPSYAAEYSMLKNYAPDVPDEIIRKLCLAFNELRTLADQSVLTYPYSTRELVNIAKHLQMFKNSELNDAIRNVFDFDRFAPDTMETVSKILRKNGIPFGLENQSDYIFLAKTHKIPPLKVVGEWRVSSTAAPEQIKLSKSPLETIEYSNDVKTSVHHIEHEYKQSNYFSEQSHFYQLPVQFGISYCALSYCDNRIVVASADPFCLWIIDESNPCMVSKVDLSEHFSPFPTRSQLEVHFSSPDSIVLAERMTNQILQFCTTTSLLTKYHIDEPSISSFFSSLSGRTKQSWRVCSWSPMTFFHHMGSTITFVSAAEKTLTRLTLSSDVELNNVFHVGDDSLLLAMGKKFGLITFEDDGRCLLRQVEHSGTIPCNFVQSRTVEKDSRKYQIFSADNYYAALSKEFSLINNAGELIASKRVQTRKWDNEVTDSCILDDGFIVRAFLMDDVPKEAFKGGPKNLDSYTSGFLEVVNPFEENVKYIAVPKSPLIVAPYKNSSMMTCDIYGGVRTWNVNDTSIKASLLAWQKMFASGDGSMRYEFKKMGEDLSKLSQPNIGKFDPQNKPHVGGGTWAGGTGGYNTAGLGGLGGPFRLDAGNDIYQVSQAAKDAVPEHIREKAREIAKTEYRKRLQEIEMSEFDAEHYAKFYKPIEKQVKIFRTTIDSLEAKEKERHWVRHQTTGDLDDGKLVEGLAGERSIFRRRIDKEPESGEQLKKPKRVRFCFDLSGSMYRFNTHDYRLIRSLESALLVMEALHGKQSKIRYDIIGHSGEADQIDFVKLDRSPVNEKERLAVLDNMLVHSQFCMNGDRTLQSIAKSVKLISTENADERFIVATSDANFDRYGIHPREIMQCMDGAVNVRVFLILVGSLGQQSHRLREALSPGRVFICTDTSQMHQILQNIFFSAFVK